MNNNTFVHKYLKGLLNSESIAIDMTAGNGNDTLFLLERCKKVYAFDISKEAIENTRVKTIKHEDKLVLINDNHINIDKYIKEEVNVIIYNLGYLPHSDNPTVTNANDTIISLSKALNYIKDGYVIITFYVGHKGGKDEYYNTLKFINDNNLNIIETYHNRKIDAPYTYIIKI